MDFGQGRLKEENDGGQEPDGEAEGNGEQPARHDVEKPKKRNWSGRFHRILIYRKRFLIKVKKGSLFWFPR